MKYHNVKTTVDGISFDSRREANRFLELTLLSRAGKISNLERQVKFVLIPAQYENQYAEKRKRGKCLEREVAYIADFVYRDPEAPLPVVEDAKGVRTKEYVIKRKLMLSVYGIRIREV